MKLINKICIAGAIDSGRIHIARMLAEITGLPIIAYEHVDNFNLPEQLRGIVCDVASDGRADRVRELGFKVIVFTNDKCDKRVNIPVEDGDITLHVNSGDSPHKVYNKLVDIFETHLVIDDEDLAVDEPIEEDTGEDDEQ
ncbi:hypothetical protein RBG11_004242 [Vibrio parahaemolyticus]|nr:hypothetical protein [Vibrio parahaemolyticus]